MSDESSDREDQGRSPWLTVAVADRRRQIILLLATRYDRMWFPQGALRTTAGFAPTRRVPCPQCGSGDRPGSVAEKRGGVVKRWLPCPKCSGVGVVAVDPMDTISAPIGSHDTHASARPRKTVKCDACQDHDGRPTGVRGNDPCPHCEGTGRRDLHVFDLQLDTSVERLGADGIDIAIDARDAAGSYHELDHALAALARARPYIVRLLDQAYLHQTLDLDRLPTHGHRLLEIGLAYIDARMPPIIRVPAGVAQNAKEHREQLKRARGRGADPRALAERDKQIRRWAREGRPYTWIAAQAGLSDRQLREIINGHDRVA